MCDLAVLILYLLATVARLPSPGGVRAVARQVAIADSHSLPTTFA
jgi:hypothetical protein